MNLKTRRLILLVGCCWLQMLFFFFKQKTAYEIVSRDWSSGVCSSDLLAPLPFGPGEAEEASVLSERQHRPVGERLTEPRGQADATLRVELITVRAEELGHAASPSPPLLRRLFSTHAPPSQEGEVGQLPPRDRMGA